MWNVNDRVKLIKTSSVSLEGSTGKIVGCTSSFQGLSFLIVELDEPVPSNVPNVLDGYVKCISIIEHCLEKIHQFYP